tara:strand:+ start:3320 stop:3517 length:198 start_codon:yes stop_codon:yes gene_type:complete
MKVKDLFDYIDNIDGDITAININNNTEKTTLRGVAGSTNCFYDTELNLPKGKYILLRAIQKIIIE